jgi:hypothetical protein
MAEKRSQETEVLMEARKSTSHVGNRLNMMIADLVTGRTTPSRAKAITNAVKRELIDKWEVALRHDMERK